MTSQFFVLSQRGDTIINREMRGDVPTGSAEVFFRKVKFWKGDPPPCFSVDNAHYCFVRRNGLYFVFVTNGSVAPSLSIELLNQLVKVFKDFCGVLNEEGIRRNYVLIYELLDEMLDFGHAQMVTSESLRSFIFNEVVLPSAGLGSVMKGFKLPDINPRTTPSTAVFKPITASNERGVRGRNEVFVDIAERISATFNATGSLLNCEIQGCVQMKSYLIGNPELRIALNPDIIVGRKGPAYGVVLDDCNFHECVRLENFERDRELLLVPPDGEFIAMNYRLTSDFQAPFKLYPSVIETGPYKIDVIIRLKADIPEQNYACNIVVTFPVPKVTSSVTFVTSEGASGQQTEYKPKQQTVSWKLKRLSGGKEVSLQAKLVLSQSPTSLTRKEISPFSLNFEIPMFNVSGVNVKFLEILQQSSKHKPYRWVRYVTYSNSYIIRL
eukprot:c4083_g1_i1.p1 GENE.c4083_g1_i1~~c4083_g1_i1.p1  ORF type:complete len:453 (+),score=109.01 c4083_g1_i1:44-1360(+)